MSDPLKDKYGSRAAVLLPICLLIFIALSAWRMWPSGQPSATATAEGDIPVHIFSGPTMGTTWKVTVRGAGDPSPIVPAIEAELAEIDRQMSDYRDDSALSAFNARRDTAPHPAPAELLQVVALAREVSERSGGAFDVTVAPLVDAWGFGRPGPRPVPSDDELAALRARVGWQRLHADLSEG
ncbi:MAG TPA: FAD:protein FMN transferase, partial [Nannocystis sp.]